VPIINVFMTTLQLLIHCLVNNKHKNIHDNDGQTNLKLTNFPTAVCHDLSSRHFTTPPLSAGVWI